MCCFSRALGFCRSSFWHVHILCLVPAAIGISMMLLALGATLSALGSIALLRSDLVLFCGL